jgi:hypothetical protein
MDPSFHASPGGVSDERGPYCLQRGPGHRRRGVRAALRGVPGASLTALHAHLHGKPYWVGPLPRLNNNLDRLPAQTQALLGETGIQWPSANTYHSVVARALEIHLALLEAIQILKAYRKPPKGYVEVTPRAGVGAACTEAPRGSGTAISSTTRVCGQGPDRPPTSQSAHRADLPSRARIPRRRKSPALTPGGPSATTTLHLLLDAFPQALRRAPLVSPYSDTHPGIGSPFGGDQLGWRVVDCSDPPADRLPRLSFPSPPAIDRERFDRPHAGCSAAVLVDTVRFGQRCAATRPKRCGFWTRSPCRLTTALGNTCA